MVFSLGTGVQVPSSGFVENYSAALGNGWWWLSDCNCRNTAIPQRLWILIPVFPTQLFFLKGCLAKAGWCCELQTLHQATSVRKPVQGSLVGAASRRLEVIDSVKTEEAELNVSGCLFFGSWRWVFSEFSFFLFSPQLFFCNNSVNMAAKGLISSLWCSGTTVQQVTIQ